MARRSFFLSLSAAGLLAQQKKMKLVVVTGGHWFYPEFWGLYEGYADLEYAKAEQKDNSESFEDISRWDYDAIVLFAYAWRITPKQQENFSALLDRGVGLLVLHHGLDAYLRWDEYPKIIGANTKGLRERKGTEFVAHIANRDHPVTRGMSDWVAYDETYYNYQVAPENQILIASEHPFVNHAVAWARRYRQARVVCCELGHNKEAYAHPAYRKLVYQSIRWVAGRA